MMGKRAVLVGSIAILLLASAVSRADQPKLGFGGTLVEVKGEFEGFRGYRVDSVRRGTPAARMGFERGDIVVFISTSMAFTTHEAYLYALRQQGRTAKIGLINVRDGKLVWTTCRLDHDPEPHQTEETPDGVIMVDFAENARDEL
jgi:S1-C subfamily serine protease